MGSISFKGLPTFVCFFGMECLAQLLYPLPEVAFATLVVAWERGGEDRCVAVARELLGDTPLLSGNSWTDLELENVFMKLRGQLLLPPRQQALPDRFVACLVVSCPGCACGLEDLRHQHARLLTMDHGMVDCEYALRRCNQYGSSFSSCWQRTLGGSMFLVAGPDMALAWQIVHVPRSNGLAFVETRLLKACASFVVRLRSSFAGIIQVLADMTGAPTTSHLRGILEIGWILWRACSLLWADPFQRAQLVEVAFHCTIQPRQLLDDCLQTLAALLRDRHLRLYARHHRCTTCTAQPSVGIDGKVSFGAALCAAGAGNELHFHATGMSVARGCISMPQARSRYCASHTAACREPVGSATAAVPLLRCPGEHDLELVAEDLVWHHACDVCARPLPSGEAFHSCLVCNYDLCGNCVAFMPSNAVATGASMTASAELDNESGFDEIPNPCGLAKLPVESYYRRHGGVLTGILACGRIVNVRLLFGKESATQVTGLLGEVFQYRSSVRFVVFDNACMLAHFVRNKSRCSSKAVLQQLSACCFVLDRYHAPNHTACLDPGHPLYTPEVDIGLYPELASSNTSWNESFNAWLDRFVPQARCMTASLLDVYVLLLADLWNTHIVPQGGVKVPVAPRPRTRLRTRR